MITNSENYKIASVVFGKSEIDPKQVRIELEKIGVVKTAEEVSEILEGFRDNGLIAKIGMKYVINE